MDADLPLVRAENADIQQIFFNLLFSAFDNAKEKGKIQVDSHYDDQAGEIVVDFEHEGSGNVLDDRQLCLQINGREKGQEVEENGRNTYHETDTGGGPF